MNASKDEYDVIIIGSGTCGAAIARALSTQGKRVLMLERGGDAPKKESLGAILSMANEVKLGEGKLSTVRALATGGSTNMYFGVVNYPPLESFRALGIDLEADLAAVKAELPIAPLPDALLNPQALRLRDAANARGHDWHKFDMLVDAKRCQGEYNYAAKWRALDYVEQAQRSGATLRMRARVDRVLTQGQTAIGVEYRIKSGAWRAQTQRAYARKIVLAAGELATPMFLRQHGMQGIGARGFYCNPGYAIYGIVPGLAGRSGFVGSMGCAYDEGIELGDATLAKLMHTPMMLGGLKWRQLFNYADTLGIGVKVKDELGGELRCSGRFYKTFSALDLKRLELGRQEAVRILERAGARHIVDFGIVAAGRVGGLVRIGEHVDAQLETPLRNLHVCDGAVLPDDMRGTPTLSLLALSRYLSRHLLGAS